MLTFLCRYCNMDYIFALILGHYPALLQKVVSYDITCQWSIHLLKHLAALPSHVWPIIPTGTLHYVILKLHICYKSTPISTPTHHMLFTFYHMITHMTLSFLSHYLRLSLLSLISILMESSRISITPYNNTLLIVLTHSTLIPTYVKSSLPYAHLILCSPLAD